MSLAGSIVTFVILWWVVLFMVLPFGVRTAEEAGERRVAGQADSAPVRPRLWLKVAVTTLIAMALWCVVYVLVAWNLLPLHLVPEPDDSGRWR